MFLKHRSYIYSEIYFHSTCFIGVISTVECTCSKKLKLSVFGLFWLAQKHIFLMQALITQCTIHYRYKFKDSFNLVHSFAIRKRNARAEVDRRSTFSESSIVVNAIGNICFILHSSVTFYVYELSLTFENTKQK